MNRSLLSVRSSLLALSLLALSLLLAACSGEPEAATPEAHAPATAVAGSHEDWCGEHEVPESLCTRCNPALIPAFQATGDWCAEHGLPESQCRICNPGLRIERPAPGAS